VLKHTIGAVLVLGLALGVAAQDKSKKTYELIYDDVQLLKEQVQSLRTRLDRNAEEIRLINEQIQALTELVRQSITDQAAIKENLQAIPSQYQDVLRKIDQISLEVQRISAELAGARAAEAVPPAGGEPALGPEQAGVPPLKKPEQKPGQAEGAAQAAALKPVVPPLASNVSPQEAYRMAYNDYLKGNYDLAVESFKLYLQQFPASPLADNALYWIGECHFSQKKFAEAIDSFNRVILLYPQGDKVAAAYLKKGISYMELGKKDEALAVFKILVTKYPLQEETRIAQDKIKELTGK
jgi:tol-pal system protein YbgF